MCRENRPWREGSRKKPSVPSLNLYQIVDSRIVAGRQQPFAQLQRIHTLSANCEFAHYRISHVQRKSGLTGRTAASPKMVGGRLRAVSDIRHQGRIADLRCMREIEREARRKRTLRASARLFCCANAANGGNEPDLPHSQHSVLGSIGASCAQAVRRFHRLLHTPPEIDEDKLSVFHRSIL